MQAQCDFRETGFSGSFDLNKSKYCLSDQWAVVSIDFEVPSLYFLSFPSKVLSAANSDT